ncbi:cysteine dioxygenase [Modestobacter sp. I12A-02628]|uniref:Cysteine dioxygenase n=1 Tax=Goekera deserti TaxID=2497753 RepID=A0A7K3W9V2_9ACTN|nr:cysteine dioxygenase family protein [Goekera deserti]MPQ98828.1 cysteine dioxygenase [Goekera deserti]NDI49673.1 cysteine dioxygenase [Goekera deserti]NEL53134.1 cysteine dioxygenase [Goekera deserti]
MSTHLSTALRDAHAHPATHPATRPSSAAALAVAIGVRPDLWTDLLEFREESRWTHQFDTDVLAASLDPSLHAELAEAQVWLLTWLPGQGTPLHDHGSSAGAFAVARGTLTERVVAAGRPGGAPRQSTADLEAGRVRYFGAHYVHQVVNTLHEPAVSVHVYAPRLTLMNTYRIDAHGLTRTGTERAGVDW